MNLADKKRDIDNWFNSPKATEYFARIKREQDRNDDWIEKLYQFEQTLDDDALLVNMLKFVDWESEYQSKQYKRGNDCSSSILSLLFEYAMIQGTTIENDEDFPTDSFEFRGFVINVTHGQGSVIWITYKGERIL